MAKKTIVRYKPPNEIVGARELLVADFAFLGIFTQREDLRWTKETGWWVDGERISAEALAWLRSDDSGSDATGWFAIEEQEVPDETADEDIAELEGSEAADERDAKAAGLPAPGPTAATNTKGGSKR